MHTNWSLASRLASVLVLLKLDGIVRGMIDGIYVLEFFSLVVAFVDYTPLLNLHNYPNIPMPI